MKKRIGTGVEFFSEIRERNAYYVDKTECIREILESGTKVYLITRPRRFGKTLMLNTLEAFLDIRKDSRKLFEGLRIAEDERFANAHRNRYPVLSLSLKGLKAGRYAEAFDMLAAEIAQLCSVHAYLLDSPRVDEDDKKRFRELKAQTASSVEVKRSLFTLTRMLHAHFGVQTVLLVDEYDVPLAGAEEYGYYDEMLLAVRSLFEAVLKTNPYLDFAVLTGCLRVSRESLFTGLNNLTMYGIMNYAFSDRIGFTEPEVQELLAYYGLEEHYGTVKEWYDGYHFADTDIYCPWDVLNYCADLLQNPLAEPSLYWKNSSGNAQLERFIHRADAGERKDFQELLADRPIRKSVTEQLTYHTLAEDANHIWSLLLLTGYLTTVRLTARERREQQMGAAEQLLVIPNREMKELVTEIVGQWFCNPQNPAPRQPLTEALLRRRPEEAQKLLAEMLYETISYYDYREDFYHAFLAGILSNSGYVVRSNREQGEGRSDICLYDDQNHRAVVMELKHAGSVDEMPGKCREALRQISRKRYAEALADEYDEIIRYGIAFYKKRCRIETDTQ